VADRYCISTFSKPPGMDYSKESLLSEACMSTYGQKQTGKRKRKKKVTFQPAQTDDASK
jgi:hypothetical protein